jgi:HAMP domain-containing protein
VLRVGISLRRVEGAREQIVRNALVGGLIVLVIGVLGAWFVALRITRPVLALEESAARMAAGDLAHRSGVDAGDEIGSLSRAFNRMADVLERSFARLRGTVAAFERFVPRKFLAVIAPTGIENIQVGARQERVMTILFCDIRGYTSLSEASTRGADVRSPQRVPRRDGHRDRGERRLHRQVHRRRDHGALRRLAHRSLDRRRARDAQAPRGLQPAPPRARACGPSTSASASTAAPASWAPSASSRASTPRSSETR